MAINSAAISNKPRQAYRLNDEFTEAFGRLSAWQEIPRPFLPLPCHQNYRAATSLFFTILLKGISISLSQLHAIRPRSVTFIVGRIFFSNVLSFSFTYFYHFTRQCHRAIGLQYFTSPSRIYISLMRYYYWHELIKSAHAHRAPVKKLALHSAADAF